MPTQGPDTEARLQGERAKYRRLILAFYDLSEVREYLSALSTIGPRGLASASTALRDAVLAAIVISYGRCFVSSEGADGGRIPIPERFLRGLTEGERAAHSRLLTLRHREFAHSDTEVAQVKVQSWKSAVLMPQSRVLRHFSVSDDDLTTLGAICEKLHIYIVDEMERLSAQLAEHGGF